MPESHTIIDDVLKGSTAYSKEDIEKAALDVYENQAAHQCYWNNRFFLAVKFDLPEEMQRTAAWKAITNGLNGYWEWRTHSGYDLVQAMQEIGITEGVPEKAANVPDHLYIPVEKDVLAQIARKFNLPTKRFDKSRLNDWADEDRDFRKRLADMTTLFWNPPIKL